MIGIIFAQRIVTGQPKKFIYTRAMAARDLKSPAAPRPFSVLSENHVRTSLDLPVIPEHERFSFGVEYDKEMCRLVNKHLEVSYGRNTLP